MMKTKQQAASVQGLAHNDQMDSYRTLICSVRREIAAGLARAQKLVEAQRTVTYWTIGRHINTYLATAEVGRGVITTFYEKLSRDLDIDPRTLQHCEQFFRYYPKLDVKKPLTWSHYRCLLMAPSDKERRRLEARILKEGLSVEQCRGLMIDARGTQSGAASLDETTIVRGRLYTYRIVKVDYVQDTPSGMMVDCGFEVYIPPPVASGTVTNKRMVISVKSDDGSYAIKLSNATSAELYTYKAIIERIVDADTVWVAIDCGFGIWCRQKLRFAGIDAPEKRTVKGDKAVRWLTRELAQCAFVVVKTAKSDKYDRYLVDVFYLPGETDAAVVASRGQWLNSRMVNVGLAQMWTGE